MAKFVGTVGVITGFDEEYIDGIPSGRHIANVKEYAVRGEILQNRQTPQEHTEGINRTIRLNQRFSFIAPPDLMSLPLYLNAQNFAVYIEIQGVKWTVTDISVEYPRIIFSTGGVWIDEQ